MPNAQQANLIVLGHTGAGKSSFINYLIGENLLKTGRGEPITQHFDSYTADKAFGLPTRIYDSKGLEVAEYQEMSDEIIRFIQEKCEKEDIYQWIHVVFYCINRTKARLDDSELNLIRRIQNETLRTVHVVLTNCDGSSEDEPIKNYVQESLGKNTPIYCVSSVAEKTRRGTTYQFGKEAIIEGIFKVLWQDILRVIAKTTAKQFSQFFDMSMEEFFELLKIKIADKDREFEDENILRKFVFSKEIEKRREIEFIKITGGLLKRKIDAIKTYNHAIAYKSQNELDSFAQFFNRYGVANHFHMNKTAICNVANKISETLENAANRLEKKYAKGKAGDAADIYYIISTQIFHQGAIMGLFARFLMGLLNEPTSCNQFCNQIVGFVKNEFPTEAKLESLLLKNMLDLRVEKTLQTPNQMEDKLHHPKKNLPAQRKKAVITVDGNHAEATVIVRYPYGIHARPASEMVKTASKFKSKIQLKTKGRSIDAKSIVMVIGAGLAKGTEVKFCADGPDAEKAVKALTELIESFGEETC